MRLSELVERVIVDGIAAVKADYSKPEDKQRLEGALKGFEECRGKDPAELQALLYSARQTMLEKFNGQADVFWYWRCREAEIEWVCNVVSAGLHSIGEAVIVVPTVRGCMKLMELWGKESGLLLVEEEVLDERRKEG